MTDDLRLTGPVLKILGALMSYTGNEISGAEIGRIAKLASGTLYPILIRLEHAHWVESRWETENPHALGRPRRRLYRLTGVGVKKAKAAFQDVTSAIGGLAWS
jgi:PadR family transcriptional regulator, regulatory protein PadR